jgi:hypothetical protein
MLRLLYVASLPSYATESDFLQFTKLLYLTSCSGAASVPGLPAAPRLQGNFSKLHNHTQPLAPNYKFWKKDIIQRVIIRRINYESVYLYSVQKLLLMQAHSKPR